MTHAEALQQINDAGLRGIFGLASHARDRMAERRIRWADVRHGLQTARACSRQSNGRYSVPTTDLDAETLLLIVVIDAGVIVVTVY